MATITLPRLSDKFYMTSDVEVESQGIKFWLEWLKEFFIVLSSRCRFNAIPIQWHGEFHLIAMRMPYIYYPISCHQTFAEFLIFIAFHADVWLFEHENTSMHDELFLAKLSTKPIWHGQKCDSHFTNPPLSRQYATINLADIIADMFRFFDSHRICVMWYI